MTSILRLVVALVSGLLLATVAASPAGAMKPQTFTVEFDDQFTDDESCPFPVDVRFVGSVRVTEFFDTSGNLVRVQGIGSDVGTATNALSGKTARGVDHWLEVFDVASGEFAILGLFFHMNFPGAGIVLIDAGHIAFDAEGNLIKLAGPHQVFEGDFAALCEALA